MNENKHIGLTLETITNKRFQESLGKLGESSLGMKDRFALALTMKAMDDALQAFDKSKRALFESLGCTEADYIKRRLAEIGETPDDNQKLEIESLKRRAQELNGNARFDAPKFVIPPERKEEYKKQEAELLSLNFETLLTDKIVIPEDCKLTANELSFLTEIVKLPC